MSNAKLNADSPIWHPMTQHATAAPAIPIERAEGVYLHTTDGRRILDAISSWWVITHGHGHVQIVEAVQNQTAKLEQVIFSGFTHAPAETLAARLLDMAGKPASESGTSEKPLSRVFFSDSGSMAVESAMKMVIGYFEHTGQNKGVEKRKIIALEGGYHGDTFGAMSAGAPSIYNALYEPYLFDVAHLPFPDAANVGRCLHMFENHLKGGDVAALILEPMVQGASGMNMYSADTLRKLHSLCKKYGALLIADEIMTGFGRTGEMFACQHAGIVPDIMCLSKGLTAGFLPMSVTLCTDEIYNAFLHQERSKMFLQSSSYAGNPIACAAALANLDVWESEAVFEKIQRIERSHLKAQHWFDARTDVENVRVMGSIFALDVIVPDDDFGYLSNIRDTLYKYYLEHNVLLRPLGNTVYILPPYCITNNELEQVYGTIWRSLDSLRHENEQRAA